MMTLYLTPVVYTYMDALTHRKKKDKPHATKPALTTDEAALSKVQG